MLTIHTPIVALDAHYPHTVTGILTYGIYNDKHVDCL